MFGHGSPITLVTRTRDKWKKGSEPKSLEENAVALAYIIWQLALNGAKKLHSEDFRYDTDDQRIRVIEEYLAYLVHLSDRMVFDTLDYEERCIFVSTLAAAVARHLQRNKEEITGRGSYREDFLDMVNARCEEYAFCSMTADGPGYQMLKGIGSKIQTIMGSDQTNKWVIDQVMGIEAPDMFERLKKSLTNLYYPARKKNA